MITKLLTRASLPTGLLLGGLCLGACTRPLASPPASLATPACCQSRYPANAFNQFTTKQLGQDYQRLRRLKCPACSYYESDFHQLLKELGTRLNGQPRATIKHLMGRPDATEGNTLLYYWRYKHDYLRFRLAADGTASSSWYLALE